MREIALIHGFHSPQYLFKVFSERLIIDRAAVNDDTLIDLNQVGGSEKPRPFFLRTEHPVKIRAHGTFSVSSRHMDHLQAILWVAEIFQKGLRVYRIILLCKFRNFQYILYCFFVCHSSCSSSCSTNA